MPFKSPAQEKFMFANHPDIAKRWASEHPENARTMMMKPGSGSTVADNKPVGSAGQPFPFGKAANGNKKPDIESKKMAAIERRMKKAKDSGKKN